MIKDSNLERNSVFSDCCNISWQCCADQSLNFTITGLFHLFKEKKNHYKLIEISYSKPYLVKKTKKNVLKVIDVRRAIIFQIKNEIVGEGISLKLNNYNLQIYGQVLKLLEALKEICIQVNFHEQYFLYRQISSSLTSKVFLAEKKQNKIDYVVKVFEKNNLQTVDNENGLQALKNEIQALEILQNSNNHFAQLLEIFEGQHAIYLIFNQCKGGDLQNYILDNQLIINEKMAFNAIKQILEAISILHDLNYMHRDLKPENILLENKDSLDKLIVIDFGLAQKLDNQENYIFKMCGTPGYVAPEILQNQQYDQKVDIYGIGVILYMLLTGKNPFFSVIKDVVLEMNSKGVVEFDKVQCSDLGKDLLISLLQPQPQRRPTAKQALKHRYFTLQQKATLNLEKKIIEKKKFLEQPVSEQISPLTPSTPLTPLMQKQNLKSPQHNSQFQRRRVTNYSSITHQTSLFMKQL